MVFAFHQMLLHGSLAAGALIGAWFTIGKLIAFLWRGWRAGRERARALHRVVERELTPNGGSSIKDQVGRIEARQDEILDQVTGWVARLEQHLINHPKPEQVG